MGLNCCVPRRSSVDSPPIPLRSQRVCAQVIRTCACWKSNEDNQAKGRLKVLSEGLWPETAAKLKCCYFPQAAHRPCRQPSGRTFVWLNRFRHQHFRCEKRGDIHEGLLLLGCSLICRNFLPATPLAKYTGIIQLGLRPACSEGEPVIRGPIRACRRLRSPIGECLGGPTGSTQSHDSDHLRQCTSRRQSLAGCWLRGVYPLEKAGLRLCPRPEHRKWRKCRGENGRSRASHCSRQRTLPRLSRAS